MPTEHLAVDTTSLDMPLFLRPDRFVYVPLELTYLAAYPGMPVFWREVWRREEHTVHAGM